MKPAIGLFLVVSSTLVLACGSSNSSNNASTGGSSSSAGGSSQGGGAAVGGGSATGGSSSASTCAKACGSLEECGSKGLCVAKMVTIPGSPSFKIDVTAVTQGQYKAWLATNPPLPSLSESVCGWKSKEYDSSETYDIKGNIFSGADADKHPVYMVDWCDAYGYCKAVGKRLCGKIGGGSNNPADYADASKSQLYRACSSGGANKYPYGNTFSATNCDGSDYNSTTPATVVAGSLSTCQSSVSGYAGVFDLSGNVREWEDSCGGGSEPTGVDASCRIHGGDFFSTQSELGCDFADGAQRFNAGYNAVGFRCCVD